MMNNQPIRVLHFTEGLYPGGVETLIMNIYRHIDTSKIQFDFALIGGAKGFYDKEVLERGGRIYYFDQRKSVFRNIYEVIKTQGPFHAVHSHMYFFSGAILLIAKQLRIPVRIAHAHNTYFGQKYTLKRKAYERIMRTLILKNATHMFGCSSDACKFVFGDSIMDDSRCNVLYNGFDVGAFRYDETKRTDTREKYSLTENLVVGHVGRFEDQKNHVQLIDIFSAIHKKRPDARLLMVGQGINMDSIKEKCKKLGILDAVVFAGAQKDTPSYYSAMDVFLFPSLYEGLGSVLIEAQANGLRCVTSKDTVPDDVNITGGVRFVSLEESPEVWADAVLEQTERQDCCCTNRLVKEKYDIQITASTLASIY